MRIALRLSAAQCSALEAEPRAVSAAFLFSDLLIAILRFRGGTIFERHDNFRTNVRLGTNDEQAVHPVNPFLHAYQPETVVISMRVKPLSVIHKLKLDAVRTDTQSGTKISRVGMLYRVGEGFLGNSQQLLLVFCRYGARVSLGLELRVQPGPFGYTLEQIVHRS